MPPQAVWGQINLARSWSPCFRSHMAGGQRELHKFAPEAWHAQSILCGTMTNEILLKWRVVASQESSEEATMSAKLTAGIT